MRRSVEACQGTRARELGRLLLATVCLVEGCACTGVHSVPLYLNNPKLDLDPKRSARNPSYYGEFTLGTPPQRFLGCFDTGSADVWIPSTLCQEEACSEHKRFQKNSSTYEASDYNFQIVYSTGEVYGMVVQDTLTVGTPTMTIPKQSFGLATESSDDFLRTTCDGLFGLGPKSLNQMHVSPPFFNMMSQLDKPEFSIWMNPDPRALNAGELVFGGANATRFSGNITFIPIADSTINQYWAVNMPKVLVGHTAVDLSAKVAIFDCGSSATLMSNEDFNRTHKAMPNMTYDSVGQQYVSTCGCSMKCLDALPNITLTLGNTHFVLEPEAYMMQVSSNVCVSAIVGGGDPEDVVLGTQFFRRYFTVFRWDTTANTGKVGIATANLPPGHTHTTTAATAVSVAATREARYTMLLDVRKDEDMMADSSEHVHIPAKSGSGPILGRRLLTSGLQTKSKQP